MYVFIMTLLMLLCIIVIPMVLAWLTHRVWISVLVALVFTAVAYMNMENIPHSAYGNPLLVLYVTLLPAALFVIGCALSNLFDKDYPGQNHSH